MVKILKPYYIYIISFLFIIINSVLIINEFYYLSVIPFVLVIVYMAFFSFENLMWFVVFFTPLSLNLEELAIGGVGMYLPTEPLMFGIMILFFFKLIYQSKSNVKVLYHPVTIVILINLCWILITSIFSSMPTVSFKFLLSRLWFVVCFYFIGIQLFQKVSNYKKFFLAYIIPLTGIIIYAVLRLASYNFAKQPAHWVMEPFYKDHTSYGAILAMYIPILFIFLKNKFSLTNKVLIWLMLFVFIVGVIMSYTRAAWVSLALALVLYYIYTYKVKFKYLFALGITGLLILLFSWNTLMTIVSKNNQDSSGKLSEHVESISNVSSDASNLERLNRWNSAWRMFLDRPVFGWGPGTYVFQYAPFQLSKDKTIISTNAGANGNAHSEYIGPLAESGLFGLLSFLAIVIVVFYKGSTLYHRLPKGELKQVVLFTLLGLFTYVIHGMLNNYLDTDKASVPFWGFIALIVAIDIYHSDQKNEKLLKPESE